MAQLLEFVGNHPYLVGAFFALVIMLIVTEARRGGESVTPEGATTLINRQNAVVVDLRDENAFREGHLVGAVNVPYSAFAERKKELEKYREQPLILVCDMGQTASAAGKQLKAAGFTAVYRLNGGLSAWRADNRPLVKG